MLWFVLVQLLCCYWILKQMEDLKKQNAQLQGMPSSTQLICLLFGSLPAL